MRDINDKGVVISSRLVGFSFKINILDELIFKVKKLYIRIFIESLMEPKKTQIFFVINWQTRSCFYLWLLDDLQNEAVLLKHLQSLTFEPWCLLRAHLCTKALKASCISWGILSGVSLYYSHISTSLRLQHAADSNFTVSNAPHVLFQSSAVSSADWLHTEITPGSLNLNASHLTQYLWEQFYGLLWSGLRLSV